MSTATTAGRTVALAGRPEEPRVAEAMQILAAHLIGRGVRVRAATGGLVDYGPHEVELVAEPELVGGVDFVVAVGGDGTMLHAARAAAAHDVPVLGINRGRLGFLADVGPARMLESVDDALEGRCVPERRMLLQATVSGAGATRAAIALNDVAVAKHDTGRMLDLQTWVDGAFVNTHAGDGFIVSTSTGSTAYALSCGGPIVHPALAAIVLVPICPHTLSDRPIVVGADSVVELELAGRPETRAQVVCDGIPIYELEPGLRLRVERATVSATLLHPPDHDYFRILRSKLHWGRGGRSGRPPAD
ncbi:MAG: NAD(+)/NADH kinase [Steroidobacteraceae bacterium]